MSPELDWGLKIAGGPVRYAIGEVVGRASKEASDRLTDRFERKRYATQDASDGGKGGIALLVGLTKGIAAGFAVVGVVLGIKKIASRGRTWQIPQEVLRKFPSSWGNGIPNRKGIGTRWADPNDSGNGVRIDQGNPKSGLPSQRVDHVIVRRNGVVIGRDGKPISGSINQDHTNAHIPLSEYKGWSSWDSPT